MMDRTEAFYAGVEAGRASEKGGAILNAIEPPADYTDAQRGEFVSGYINGARWQREDDLMAELSRHSA